MGLWLKCPVCQAINPLYNKVCTSCQASLEHLPMEKRVYTLEAPGAPGPEPSTPSTPPETTEEGSPATGAPEVAPQEKKAANQEKKGAKSPKKKKS